jgi:acyl-CoA dehydrogenase
MSEDTMDTRTIIIETANKIFANYCDKQLLDTSENGVFPTDLWGVIVENGFNLVGCKITETDAIDMYTFIRACGRFAVPLPLAETLLVNQWCGEGEGIYSIGVVEAGCIVDVPWGRVANKVVGVSKGSSRVVIVDTPEVLEEKTNLAGEPRDTIRLTADAPYLDLEIDPYAQVALTRVQLMAGCLESILNLGIQYAGERSQFGRTLSKFQVIQHSLALSAAETSAVLCAADAAAHWTESDRFVYEVAASKARVGGAVAIVTDSIHQIHGAMGFTHEHRLHHFTRRAWAWREEWGNEFYWQSKLGKHLSKIGADDVWNYIATAH